MINIVTAVWGDWHVDAFARLNAWTLMDPTNLPALARAHPVRYDIYTTARDIPRMLPAVQRLRTALPTDVHVLSRRYDLDRPIAAHAAIWRDAVGLARRAGHGIILMPPDVVWSAGSLAHLARLITQERAAVCVAFPRVDVATWREGPAKSGRDLMADVLAHLHPLTRAYDVDSPNFPAHREMLVWPAPDGLVMRALAREPLYYNPRACGLTEHNLPKTDVPVHLVGDSDDLLGVSLAPADKDAGWYRDSGRLTKRLAARWWLDYPSPVNDAIARQEVLLHAGPVDDTWDAVRRRSAAFMGHLIAARRHLERERHLLQTGREMA